MNRKLTQMIKKISPYTIRKGFRYLRHYGVKEFAVRMQERLEPDEVPYDEWYPQYVPTQEELDVQRAARWKDAPCFSIAVPVFRTPKKYLCEMIGSVMAQTYGNWELCIVNADPSDDDVAAVLADYRRRDDRIRVQDLSENRGIAENTNCAIHMASGNFVGFLDHDDCLAPNALYELARAVVADDTVDVLYTDEDKITEDGSEHFQPNLKPDFSPDLLRSNNYICHFFVVRKTFIKQVGGFRTSFDGAQDYDLILRSTEQARTIHHVPEILYHWRTHAASTADNPVSKQYAYEAGRRAIEEHLHRVGTEGVVMMEKDFGFYRVQYPVKARTLISIIIPNKDQADTLRICLESIRRTTKQTVLDYEILIVENNSTNPETFRYYETLKDDPRIRLLTWEHAFNFSAINNFAVRQSRGEYLLFLNNDIEAETEGWLDEMAGVCARNEVGAVGAKLYYPDNTLQHAGCVIGMGGIAGHMFTCMPKTRSGYMHRASILQDMSAVTAACMMVKREAYDRAGGFEEKLAVAFNDIDFCLKIRQNGYLIVYDPYASLKHDESKSRGPEDNPDKVRRFQSEIAYIETHWATILKEGDPYYNKNLSLKKWNYSLKPNHKRSV